MPDISRAGRHLVTLMACVVLAAPCLAAGAAPDRAGDRSVLADRAHAARPSVQFTKCLRTAKGMRAMQHCDSQEVDFQQRKLDRIFASLIKARRGDRSRLEADQASWSERKDAKCLVFSRRRGSLNSLKAMDCFRDEIIKRQLELAKFQRAKSG